MTLAPELEARKRVRPESGRAELRVLEPERRIEGVPAPDPTPNVEPPTVETPQATALPTPVSGTARRSRLPALEAQRIVDWLTLHLAPAVAAGLIAYSHTHRIGECLVVFSAVLAASQSLVSRAQLPLALMPAGRIVLGLAAPVIGAGFAWLAAAGVGASHHASQYEAVVLGAWLVLALGAWIRSRVGLSMAARVSVIGPRDFAADLAAELDASGVRSYDVVGWIGGEGPAQYRRLRWLGGLEDVRAAVISEGIELLVAAPSAGEYRGDDVAAEVAERCIDLPVRLIAANQLYEETFGHVPIGTIDATWYRYIMHPRFHASSPLSKHVFDLVTGVVIGLFALPIIALTALAIKLSDRGPIFYRQRRLGENGKPFEIVKLRTMRVDAERGGPQWSAGGDERVTKIGRMLRRTHIDELPQLWNVLRGDMTLVGPRPERPEIVAELERRFPHYTRRQLVKPGITGWGKLRCGYAGSELGKAWELCHDLFYIKRRSILADMLIMVETGVESFRDAHRALRAPDERFLISRESHSG
jgi:exopolysaccharide biosynthesis polyprenyl glycosylphosphotransferase